MASEKKKIEVSPEVRNVVTYLKKSDQNPQKPCFYDNISQLVGNLLTERAKDNKTSVVQFHGEEKENEAGDSQDDGFAALQIKLFDNGSDDNDDIKEEDFEIPLANLCRTGHFFEQAGIGFGQEETVRIFLALKALALECTFVNVRFWGKIFGIQANYYIAEAEYRDGEGEISQEESQEQVTSLEESFESLGNDVPCEDEGLPKPDWKEPGEVTPESHHQGANKHDYFICKKLGDPWIKLPHVTPTEISTSRHITKLLTGNLDFPIKSYPNFYGTEANYLRALIARISASTQISPTGYFVFDDEGEEDDEEELMRDSYLPNMTYEGIPVRQLKDNYHINWVHNVQYILPQGRCTWWDPQRPFNEDFEEEEEENEEEIEVRPETGYVVKRASYVRKSVVIAKCEKIKGAPQLRSQQCLCIHVQGPQLLSTLGNDEQVSGHSAWSACFTSRVLPEYSTCLMKSNRWPGAYAFSDGKLFENIYIGWGQKYSSSCYNPSSPPTSMEEFKGEEVWELSDPTVEQEEDAKIVEEEANKSADEIENVEEDED